MLISFKSRHPPPPLSHPPPLRRSVDVYIGQLKCELMWYASNNEMVHCKTQPLHWWGSGAPGYKLMYSNFITATLTSCPSCNFEYGDDWTPRIRRSSAVMPSRGRMSFGGVLKGKFARQYAVDFGEAGRCEGVMRKGTPQLGFGLDYEQQLVHGDKYLLVLRGCWGFGVCSRDDGMRGMDSE